MTFCKDDSTEQIGSCARYFSVEEPKKTNTDGLIACLQEALQPLRDVDVLNRPAF